MSRPALLEGKPMARKPNYRFERLERERTRAAKKAARAKAKAERAEQAKEDATDAETETAPSDEN
jgi:hypothetical protein